MQGEVGAGRVYLGRAASERALRRALAGRAIVHIASHAALSPSNPLFSYIELAAAGSRPEEDGRLEVHELLEIAIHSPLVFLSGCETGLGAAWSTDFIRGEDYATLAQAFLYAGAANVVATLWPVEDEGAATLASLFYSHLRGIDPSTALAEAQRDLIEDPRVRAPYHWAAYRMAGASEAALLRANPGIASVQQ